MLSSSHVPSQITASRVVRTLAHSVDGSPPPWPLTQQTLVAARSLLLAGTLAASQEMLEFVSAYVKREHDWACVTAELNALLRPRRIEPPFDSNGARIEFGMTPVEWRCQLAALELARAIAEGPGARSLVRQWVQHERAAEHIMAAAANCFYGPIKVAASACLYDLRPATPALPLFKCLCIPVFPVHLQLVLTPPPQQKSFAMLPPF
jgi:hypothetical protein